LKSLQLRKTIFIDGCAPRDRHHVSQVRRGTIVSKRGIWSMLALLVDVRPDALPRLDPKTSDNFLKARPTPMRIRPRFTIGLG
jgi:hypothetical protein